MHAMVELRRLRSRDDGGIVVGWLTKIVVVVGLVGVLAFDAISIGVSRLAVEDAGALAAREASTEVSRSGDVQAAYAAAVTTAAEANPLNEVPPEAFEALPDGGVRLTVAREATTFVVHRVAWIADWARVRATVTGRPLP
ncbi:MAG: hypothetical protein ACOYXW_16925 [Actinomycetota bacterium]